MGGRTGDELTGPLDPCTDERGDERSVRLSTRSGEPGRFEEQGEDGVGLFDGDHRPRRPHELAMIGGRRRQRRREGGLEPQPHCSEDLTDQIVLRREVVDDHSVAHAQTLCESPEGELAESLVEHRDQRAVEDLFLGVPVPHRP